MTATQELPIRCDFRGEALPRAHQGRVQLGLGRDGLRIVVEAPYFADPAPRVPVGPTDRLWEHEVCEIFIADDAEHYLEVELSPHGHHLVLELQGIRHVVRSRLPLDYAARMERFASADRFGPVGRFYGEAWVPRDYLPVPPVRANAYAIHGPPERRCYHAHGPPGGEVPDFHKLGSFVSLQLA